MTSFGQVSQVEQGLLNCKGQVFTPRSDPVKISTPFETGAVAVEKDSSVSSYIQAFDTFQSITTETVSKDLNEQSALSYLPAITPAL